MTAFELAFSRATSLLNGSSRHILGIAGPPGSGKSTVAARLAADLGAKAVVLPMDGFHLANTTLTALGRAHRKGAADTFDVSGFIALLQRLKPEAHQTIYAPEFYRDLEESIAGAITIEPEVSLVIVEGNYLLAPEAWAPVRALLDEAWYIETPPDLRQQRLEERHQRYGRSHDDARTWIAQTDRPNTQFIEKTKMYADWVYETRPF